MLESILTSLWVHESVGGSHLLGAMCAHVLADLGVRVGEHNLDRFTERVHESWTLVQTRNPDLLRALRLAECEASIVVCELTLTGDYKTGVSVLRSFLGDAGGWDSFFAQLTNEEVRSIVKLRRELRELKGYIERASAKDLDAFVGAELKHVKAIVRTGVEQSTDIIVEQLESRLIDAYLAALGSALAKSSAPKGLAPITRTTRWIESDAVSRRGVELPQPLCDRFRKHWLHVLAWTFREQLKSYPRARDAFFIDTLCGIESRLDKDISHFSSALAAVDARVGPLVGKWRELRELVEQLGEGIEERDRLNRIALALTDECYRDIQTHVAALEQKVDVGFDRVDALVLKGTSDVGAKVDKAGADIVARLNAIAPVVQFLPAPPPAAPLCVARETEVTRIVQVLLSGAGAPMVLLGPAGIGKSTIALAAMTQPAVVSRFGDRRFLIRCDGITTSLALMERTAEALGIAPNARTFAMLALKLREAPSLIGFDNFDTPWEMEDAACEDLLDQLAVVPLTAIIASVRGEESPAVGRWPTPIKITRLTDSRAKSLFLRYATEVVPNAPMLDDLIHEMDGVPLALTLLAAQTVGDADIPRLLDRWNKEKTELLKRGAATDRITSWAISIGLSVNGPRMTSGARQLLAALSTLPSGLARADLESLFPENGVRDAATLVKTALAYWAGERLQTLAPIREFALAYVEPTSEARVRVRDRFLDIAITLGPSVGSKQGRAVKATLEHEAANIESVLLRALESKCSERVADAAIAMTKFARFSGQFSTKPLMQVLKSCPEMTIAARAHVLSSLGGIALARSDHERAIEQFESARELYERVGDVLGQANCGKSLGTLAFRCSEDGEATTQFERALQLYEQVGDVLGEANCILGLGQIALRRSDHEHARIKIERAFKLYQSLDTALGQANCIKALGAIALERSEHTSARAQFERALQLYEDVGDTLGQADCIRSLGNIDLARSDHARATDNFERALPLFQQVGDVLGQADCISSLGKIALDRSDNTRANDHFDQALKLYEQISGVMGQASCIMCLGQIAFRRSDHGLATDRFQRALTLFQQGGGVLGQANCIKNLGDIAFQRFENARARELFEGALKLYTFIGSLHGQANCIKELAQIALRESDHARAKEQFERAQELSQEAGAVHTQASCIVGLGDIACERSDYSSAKVAFERALDLYQKIGAIQAQANCIISLGDIALQLSDHRLATEQFGRALKLFSLVDDAYSVGWTCVRLARLTRGPARRSVLVRDARAAWLSIDRPDLVELLGEFGTD